MMEGSGAVARPHALREEEPRAAPLTHDSIVLVRAEATLGARIGALGEQRDVEWNAVVSRFLGAAWSASLSACPTCTVARTRHSVGTWRVCMTTQVCTRIARVQGEEGGGCAVTQIALLVRASGA